MMKKYLQLLCFLLVLIPYNLSGYSNKITLFDSSSVELKYFNSELYKNTVRLKWETRQDKEIKTFEIERRAEAESNFETITTQPSKSSSNSTRKYAFLDRLPGPGSYIYRIKIIEFSGDSKYSAEIKVDVVAPSKFSLGQNFPNPFNPSTMISFNLAVDSDVRLSIYNVLGQEVSVLVDENLSVGLHEVTFNTSDVQGGLMSGVYFYKIEANGSDGSVFNSIKKMIFTK